MVKIVVKKGNDIEFLYETNIDTPMEKIYSEILTIFNARIKISDVNYELGRLALHGPVMPLNMQGLAPGQTEELGLKDEFAEQLDEDWVANPDPLGKRCGRQPPERLQSVLTTTAENAKQAISKQNAEANLSLSVAAVSEILHQLRGAVIVLFPGGLPDHDPAHLNQFECDSPAAIAPSLQEMLGSDVILWFCGRQLPREGKLSAALSTKNDKTKVTVKVSAGGQGPPAREPALSEQERLQMMAHFRQKQEELERCLSREWDGDARTE